MRLGYAKPELNVETFSPKEDVSACMRPLTEFDSYIYLDLNHSGQYTRGEFMNGLASISAPDGHYLGVQTYALLRSLQPEGPLTKYNIGFSAYNHQYETTDFTLAESIVPRYRFQPLEVLDVKIADGRAYFNLT